MNNFLKILPAFFVFLFTLTPLSDAQPDGYGSQEYEHHEMGGMSHGMDYPMGYHGYQMGYMMKPHNAAVHFLQMKEALGLNEKQVNELKALRDAYRTENGTNEARLRTAEQELKELMEEDTINLEKAEAKLKEIGGLEGPLWLSFVRQLAKIKSIVPKEQMKKMHEMKRSHPMMDQE
ncbi:MAG: Spy/CpxP family protein refolding chaperone [Nitrospiria bacterium]